MSAIRSKMVSGEPSIRAVNRGCEVDILSPFIERMVSSHYRHGAGVTSSHRGHSAAVDDIFRTSDRGGTGRCKESNEIRHFSRLGWTSDRDAAERVH